MEQERKERSEEREMGRSERYVVDKKEGRKERRTRHRT